jgi:topoisomerase-4 subunit A
MEYIGLADSETTEKTVFTALYINDGVIYLKRFRINKFIANREYSIIPEGAELLEFTTREDGKFRVRFVPTKTMRKFEVDAEIQKYAIKGVGAKGYKITDKEFSTIEYHKPDEEPTKEESVTGLPLFEESKPTDDDSKE